MLTYEILVLSIASISILCILFLLLVYLMFRKAIDISKRTIIEKQKEKYHSFIFMRLMEGNYSRGLTPRTNLQKIAIEELLNQLTKLLEGEQEKRRLNELAVLYLADHYRKRLKSRKWSVRMNALYHIEDFKIKSLNKEIFNLIEKKKVSQEEIIHTLRILASFQFASIPKLLSDRFDDLSEYEYRNILIRLDRDLFEQFLLGFHRFQKQLQNALLDVIAVKKELIYVSFTEKIFFAYSGEVKLRAMKALAELGYVKNIDPFLDLLLSPKWEERMVTAKLFGALKETKSLPKLIELMHDNMWWVRSQAGQAIAQFPNGKEILHNILETSKDPFARDMAWEWLHKGV